MSGPTLWRVGAANIVDEAVTTEKIAPDAITPAKLDGLLGLAARGPMPLFAAFSRAGVAYDDDAVVVPADTPVFETLAVCSPVTDLTALTDETGTGVNLHPLCSTPLYQYAVEYTDRAKTKIWRRLKSGVGTWAKTNNTAVNISTILACSDESILLVLTTREMYHSIDGGATLRLVLTMDAGKQPCPWSKMPYVDNGTTIILGEYVAHPTDDGVNIWRATLAGLRAAAVFVSVHTIPVVDAGVNSHTHAIWWHAGTQRWFCSRGDSTNDELLASSDDGVTWSVVIAAGAWRWQAMCPLDWGHPTDILLGGDSTGGMYRFNTVTLEVEQIGVSDHLTGHAYAFRLWYEDGLFYQMSYASSAPADGYRIAIYVSPDGEHWTALTVFPATTIEAWITGTVDGQLQISASTATAYQHWTMAAPTVVLRQAILSHGTYANILTAGIDEATAGWVGYLGTVAISHEPWIGEHSLACTTTTPGAGAPQFGTPKVAVSENDYLGGMVRCKKPAAGTPQGANLGLQFSAAPYTLVADAYEGHVLTDRWVQMNYGPSKVTHAGGANAGLGVSMVDTAGRAGTGLVDGVAMFKVTTECPTRWHPCGATRAADQIVLRPYLPATWTCRFTFHPDINTGKLRFMPDNMKLIVASWQVSADAWATLYILPYSGDAMKFTLEVTHDNSTMLTSIQTAAIRFQRYQSLQFGVRLLATGAMQLTVGNGGAVIEHCTATTDTDFTGMGANFVTMRNGGLTHNAILPGLFSDIEFYGRALTDAELAAAMGQV